MDVAATARRAMVEHATDRSPAEACGLLGGRKDGPTVVETIETANIADDPDRFEIDPAALLSGLESFEARGLELVGFYHSHSNDPPIPSSVDRASARWTGYYTVVVSLLEGDPRLGAWFDDGEAFHPEPLRELIRR